MHRRRLAFVVSVGLAAVAGCRSAHVSSHIETVNAEYRQLEDYVYCLEDENARLEHELEALRSGRPAAGAAPRRGFLQRSGVPESDVPEIEVPGVPSETPPRRLNRPELNPPGGADAPELEPPTVELSSAAAPIAPVDTRVVDLFLNPVFTGGSDTDGQSGDDGLSVALEPRNAAGEFVPQAGTVSIVVLDPSKAGEAARVARWDFDAEQVQERLDTPKAARGIHLAMPWPAGLPASERLHLFVRYETPDNRRIQADREIFITQPGQVSQRWTPRQPDNEQASEKASGGREPPESAESPATLATPEPTPAVPAWSPLR